MEKFLRISISILIILMVGLGIMLVMKTLTESIMITTIIITCIIMLGALFAGHKEKKRDQVEAKIRHYLLSKDW